jgi:plasmid stabilization system protein ParE
MPSPVGFHPQAVAEAAAAAEWYRRRNDAAGAAFLAELDQAIDSVADAPDRWPSYLHGTRRFLLRRFPFLVVYRPVADGIEVVAVAHGRRRPGYWKGR